MLMVVILAQELDVKHSRSALAPSSAATMPAFQNEQGKRPVFNSRPSHDFGLPIGLFHPVLNSFQAAMMSAERFSADAKTYSSVRSLFLAFSNVYKNEQARLDAINKPLTALLGSLFYVIEGAGVRGDGVIIGNCGSGSAYLAIREIKK
jgi:hypothetical protein